MEIIFILLIEKNMYTKHKGANKTFSHDHCSRQDYTVANTDLPKWRVYAGLSNISSTFEPFKDFYHIRRVIKHPGFETTRWDNNLAIIITVEPMQ